MAAECRSTRRVNCAICRVTRDRVRLMSRRISTTRYHVVVSSSCGEDARVTPTDSRHSATVNSAVSTWRLERQPCLTTWPLSAPEVRSPSCLAYRSGGIFVADVNGIQSVSTVLTGVGVSWQPFICLYYFMPLGGWTLPPPLLLAVISMIFNIVIKTSLPNVSVCVELVYLGIPTSLLPSRRDPCYFLTTGTLWFLMMLCFSSLSLTPCITVWWGLVCDKLTRTLSL